MLIFDAHLDLAYNAVDWNRNLEWSIAELRAAEAGMTALGRQTATVTFDELRTAGVGLCVATVCTRQEPKVDHAFGRITKESCYAAAMAHREYYRAQERRGWMRIVTTKSQLREAQSDYAANPGTAPLSFLLSMECADAILDPEHVHDWYAQGVRAIGLTHYGVNRYGGGTNTDVGLFPDALQLLKEMEQLGMVLDLTHLSDPAFEQAIANFGGRVVASHQNARKWANWQRQFSDDQIREVIARDGVIGAACDAIMLQEGWVRGVSKPEVTIDRVVDNIDHVCQLAGHCRCAGIGTDLDGGYGYEQTPADLNTIADLRRIPELLERRGYSAVDIADIMHGNWIRLYLAALPE
ncbi:MAG: membrane dipeptidase [Planctomycetaceae bacterium]|nr:membrane dipeptidase [Planctomycetaceae bacterium]